MPSRVFLKHINKENSPSAAAYFNPNYDVDCYLDYCFMRTILLLLVSNIFMTFAWYGHLKFKETDLWKVILVSWFIAFFEYCFQVPANRIGHGQFTAFQLKTIQEVITLVVFVGFTVLYLREEVKWNYIVGFLFILAAVFFIFKKW